MPVLTAEQSHLLKVAGCGRATLIVAIEATRPLYTWFGVGPYKVAADDPIAPGITFDGSGVLREAPVLKAVRAGQADAIDFNFVGGKGVPQAYIDDPSGTGIVDAPVRVGIIGFDGDWQDAGPIAWFWSGRGGVVTSSGGPDGRVVTLPVYIGNVGRARANLRTWSNASHQSRHPGDRLCERTSIYRITSTVTWPQ